MKKLISILMSSLLAALLCACAEIKAEYAIDNENAVSVAYTILLDKTEYEKDKTGYDEYMEKIKSYWISQGMAVEATMQDNTAGIQGKKTVHAATKEEAFNTLKEMLTDEYSLFATLDFQYAGSYIENDYYLSGTVSLKDVIRKEEGETIPEELSMSVINAAQSCDFAVKITLPGDIVSSNSGEKTSGGGLSSGIWHLKFGETTDMQFKTHYTDMANKANYESLQTRETLYKLVFYACLALGAAALVTAVVLTIIHRRKTAKTTSE
ncbi:MAG: LppM family (lipo)protein [Christensenellales bacterium]